MFSLPILREEYPRPQLVRADWLNLNGEWDFAFDDDNIGLQQGWFADFSKVSAKKITVPFAFQTPLSGINDTTFHDYCWYSTSFELPEKMKEKQIILHFGAVDYLADVYINGHLAGSHEGGHTPFSFNITPYLTHKTESLIVRVCDPSTDETIPRGKQFWQEESAAIWYTRTTGIWQTVWLEGLEKTHITNLRFTPDVDNGDIAIEFETNGDFTGKYVNFDITFKGEKIVAETMFIFNKYTKTVINLFNQKIFRSLMHGDGWTWTPHNPNLFDIRIQLKDGLELLDEIESYFGMRKIHTQNGMVYLNNRPFYQKLVLDQGYWQQGLLTAPSDEALKQDILLAKEMGFNGARKHQKVEDPRYLYWADKLGFLVWGECAAAPIFSDKAVARLTREWLEIIARDYNHPCIAAWVPINESWGVPNIGYDEQQANHTLGLYYTIKSLDKTRLVISNDGWEMTKTDICAVHNYNHGNAAEPEKYAYYKASLYDKCSILSARPAAREIFVTGFLHKNEPILLTEFGGIAYKTEETAKKGDWGYTSATTEEEFLADYSRIMQAVYESKILHGFCYTQLTDVEQEINGLLTYDRKPKCDLAKIKAINEMWHIPVVEG
ncbi:MAG: glycoside hydrolase family 2 [Defluviitaleaceae bacterium]|nr:glycoside hydrolase family 2 [Defluviitaleaceae bacterium]